MTIKELKSLFDKCAVGPVGEALAGCPDNEKKAEFSWGKVKGEIEKLRDTFNKQDEVTKALLATGGGALGGMAIAPLFGGNAGSGAMLGAMAGGASRVNWRKLYEDIKAHHTASEESPDKKARKLAVPLAVPLAALAPTIPGALSPYMLEIGRRVNKILLKRMSQPGPK